MGRLGRKLKKVGGRVGKFLLKTYLNHTLSGKAVRGVLRKASDTYERGKTFVDGHKGEISLAQRIARRHGGKVGEKIADAVDKGQSMVKKGTGTADKVNKFIKDVTS